MTATKCAVCKAPASQKCAKCFVTAYCCRDHQKTHWKTHKSECSPYKICYSDTLGRYLEASRDIKAGEVILRDIPLMVGPKQVTPPLCLGCFTPVNGSYKCTRCGWPLCGPQCQDISLHYPECNLSRNRPAPVQVHKFNQINQMYECISPIRCLWLKEHDPDKWDQLTKMESHLERRMNTDVHEINQANVVNFMMKYLRIMNFSEEEIHTMCGVIDVNGFEIPGPNIIGLYGKACLLEHNCIPNSSRTFDSQLNIIIRASVDIPKGEHITTCYSDPMWGTANRQIHLKDSKYFKCTCDRCKDPTELDTYASSLKCDKCPSGLLLPSPNPLSPEAWVCKDCSGSIHLDQINGFLKQTGEKLICLKDNSLTTSESFLKATSSKLSENHYYRIDVKLALAQLYGKGGSPNNHELKDLPKDLLERKEQLCRELLPLTDLFCPGVTRLRGMLKFELQSALMEKYNRLPKKLKAAAQGKELIKESLELCEDASYILQMESPMQDEYQMGLQAEHELVNIRNLMAIKKR